MAAEGAGSSGLVRLEGGKLSNADSRLRWLLIFVCLTLLCSASPVLADTAEEPAPPPAVLLPDADDVAQGIALAEREEREHEEALETPAAVQEREESLEAFSTSDSPAAAASILLEAFEEQLDVLDNDPARFLSDAKLVKPLGTTTATVESEGNGQLMDGGGMPLRTEDADGDLSKVDLSLEPTDQGFETTNALVDLTIGGTAGEPIQIGEGLSISQVEASGSSEAKPVDDNIFFADIGGDGGAVDTDLLVAPVSSGVELFSQLRSIASPETLHFRIGMPSGADLHLDGYGGAEVTMEGERIAYVPPPYAVDAQGRDVVVELDVDGDLLILHVPHREADLAYPLLVDPTVFVDWVNPGMRWIDGAGLDVLNDPERKTWAYTETGAWIEGSTSCIYACWGGSGRGLFVSMPSGTQWEQQYGHWSYSAPNVNSYLVNAWANPFVRDDHGCPRSQYSQPHDYVGMWLQGKWNRVLNNQAAEVGSVDIQSWGEAFILGMATGGGNTSNYMPCWRDVYVGGAVIWLDDWENPTLNAVGPTPEGWVKKDATPRTFSVSASDIGLGVQSVLMFGVGTQNWYWDQPWCAGPKPRTCPNSRTGQITFTTNGFPYEGRYNAEGKERKFTVQVVDPTDKRWQLERSLWLDGTPPAVSLKGQLAASTDQVGSTEKAQVTPTKDDELSLPTYKLEIEANDGADRSGVKEVKVFLDGKTTPEELKLGSCGTSCPQTLMMNYTLRLPGLSPGKHSLRIVALDKVGNQSDPTRNIEFEYIPATGMKEEYVLQHFRLPDGNDYSGEAEYHGPEIAVNVMNGNVVFHERDVSVQTDRSKVELERVYNSQQPTQKDTQWGRGFSIAQMPEFEPQAGPAPQKATVTETGKISNAVTIPQSPSQWTFSSKLRAVITKTTDGYEVEPAGEDEVSVFSNTGRVEEVVLGDDTPVEFEPEEAPIFATSIGSSGTGNGQLDHPADAAVDAKGNVWVVDRINNRLVEFDEAGNFVRTAGSTGSGAGQLKSPSAIAIDSLGNISVTDTANNRIVRFNENGVFSSVLGWNVNKTKVESGGTQLEKNRCTASAGHICQAGSSGAGEGQISEPIGITTTGGQNFFVVERANNRVEKFSPQGEVLAKFGSAGSEAGQLKEPTAIAYTPIGGGYLWVADTGNNRIAAWTTACAYSRQYGKEGSGQAEFKKPVAVEADAEGNVFVGDLGNQRVQELSRGGDFITRFGGGGEFELSNPSGLLLDGHGGLWVTDTGRDQVQQWLTGTFLHASSRIGSLGTGSGQFNHPADAALDGKGNVWALDKGNNRLQKFNEKGEFVQAVGSKGGGGGQLNAPSALAIDPSGNLWVADTANNRVDEFNEKGEFVLTFGRDVNKTKVEAAASEAERNVCTAASGNVCQAGLAGSTNGQLKTPQGIAATSGGNIWIADTGNNRLKKFGPSGNLLNTLSSEGSEAGKVKEPTAIALAPDGSIWVADAGNNRIQGWSSSLSFIRQFGAEGTADGKFKRPAALDIDPAGNFWVGDQGNSRIEQFNSSGEYVSKFGNPETFRFSGSMGLVTDGKGSLWVTDTDHNRLQRRTVPTGAGMPGGADVGVAPYFDPPVIDYEYSEGKLTELEVEDEATKGEDPSLDMSFASGLVTEVASEEEGDTTYAYETGKLKTIGGVDGETKYGYDASGRMNSVTLPNGTIATITYDSTSRATSVKVDPAGPETAKTTSFAYSAEPRRTTVWGGGNPETIYDIGEDGSVFKWSYAEAPPTIASISGSLLSKKGEELENEDHTLFVKGTSAHQVASIRIVANGNSVVAETTCQDPAEPPSHICDEPPPLEWITHPSEHAPGRLDLEVVVTDFLGHQTAERFFVVVPQQPPPGPETIERPTFQAIKGFREAHGLDRANPRTQPQTNELILELLYEWEGRNPTAMTAVEQFGSPMRAPELAEMQYRREYVNNAADVIPEWVEEHAPSLYGGSYIDDRAGGLIYVGFTQDQSALIEALRGDPRLINPGAIREFPTPPTASIASLEASSDSVVAALDGNSMIAPLTTSVHVSPESRMIEVGATDPIAVKQFLDTTFGAGASIRVRQEAKFQNSASRYGTSGPIVGGAGIIHGAICTAGYGSRAQTGESRGQPLYTYFTTSAGHCYDIGDVIHREERKFASGPDIGTVRRDGAPAGQRHVTDALAIKISDALRSHSVLNGSPLEAQPIQGVQRVKKNQEVCWSGIFGGKECGTVQFATTGFIEHEIKRVFIVEGWSMSGDSGGPVWDPKTHKAVGIISFGLPAIELPCYITSFNAKACPGTAITPLLPGGGSDGVNPVLGLETLKEG